MKDVLHAGADVVVSGGEKHLCLVLESTEGLAVQDPGVVTLKFRADVVVAGIELMLPLDCLLPVWMPLLTFFLNECVFHGSTILCSLLLDKAIIWEVKLSQSLEKTDTPLTLWYFYQQ